MTADGNAYCSLELPLGEAAETFDIEKAVCSHGLFMMSPNRWDPRTRSLFRPLRIPPPDKCATEQDEREDEGWMSSVIVQVSHPRPHSLQVRVLGVSSLSDRQRRAVLDQVSRMLRISPADERNVKEFLRRVDESSEECLKGFAGRVFRSPSLFEDMVKCILLCNCQWPRTLSMARSLCELQWDLQSGSSGNKLISADAKFELALGTDSVDITPKTPSTGESKRKKQFRAAQKVSVRLTERFAEPNSVTEHDEQSHRRKMIEDLHSNEVDCDSSQNPGSSKISELDSVDSRLVTESCLTDQIGNFPTPRELAGLDEAVLAKRCNLGYRAGRILKLARSIVEGKISLRELEEACVEPSLSIYEKLVEQLRQIDGFGPFTTSNVLMCMGFYHVIPTDSETVRHLKQVHGKTSNIQTVQGVAEKIYGKYSPFQFLAYWAEVWHFYGERFGKLSEMANSDYKLITASNMRRKEHRSTKRVKVH